MLRATRLEIGFFTSCINEALTPSDRLFSPMQEEMVGDLEITRQQNRNFALAEGFQRLNRYSNSFSLFLRYQAQAERLYRRAIEDFERLKSQRGELPIEPIW